MIFFQVLAVLWLCGAAVVAGFVFLQYVSNESVEKKDWPFTALFILFSWFAVGMFLYTIVNSVDEISNFKRFHYDKDDLAA